MRTEGGGIKNPKNLRTSQVNATVVKETGFLNEPKIGEREREREREERRCLRARISNSITVVAISNGTPARGDRSDDDEDDDGGDGGNDDEWDFKVQSCRFSRDQFRYTQTLS